MNLINSQEELACVQHFFFRSKIIRRNKYSYSMLFRQIFKKYLVRIETIFMRNRSVGCRGNFIL